MPDMFHLNEGGSTSPGTRAVVYPGAGADEHEPVVLRRVTEEAGEYFILDDGIAYWKLIGTPREDRGRFTVRSRLALTEGSEMFAHWVKHAVDPNRSDAQGRPHTGSTAVRSPKRRLAAMRRLLPDAGRRKP